MLGHLRNYSLRTQCLAIGIVSAIIASTSGVIGSLSSWFIEDEFHLYERAAGEALLASEINADVAKLLLNGREYLVTHGEEDLKQTRRYLAEVKEGIAKAQAGEHSAEFSGGAQTMGGSVGELEEGIERLVVLMDERDRLVLDNLDKMGPELREQITEIIEASTRSDDWQTAAVAGMIQEDLLSARLYLAKFLLQNLPEQADRVEAEFRGAGQGFPQTDGSSQGADRRRRGRPQRVRTAVHRVSRRVHGAARRDRRAQYPACRCPRRDRRDDQRVGLRDEEPSRSERGHYRGRGERNIAARRARDHPVDRRVARHRRSALHSGRPDDDPRDRRHGRRNAQAGLRGYPDPHRRGRAKRRDRPDGQGADRLPRRRGREDRARGVRGRGASSGRGGAQAHRRGTGDGGRSGRRRHAPRVAGRPYDAHHHERRQRLLQAQG